MADAETDAGGDAPAGRSGGCVECGASLHGVSHRGRCRSCKRPVRESVGRPKRFIDLNVCSRCGYSLSGLADWREADASCPECGVGMMIARLGSDLPRAKPRSLRRLAYGLGLLSWSVCVSIVGPIFSMALAAGGVAIFGMGQFDSPAEAVVNVVIGVLLIGSPLIAAVLWFVGWASVDRAFRDRRLAGGAGRASGVMLRFLIGGGVVFGAGVGIGIVGSSGGVSDIVYILLGVSGGLLCVSLVAGMLMLRAVAARSTVNALKTGATQLAMTAPLAILGFAAIGADRIFASLGVDWLGSVLGCIALIWPFAFLSFALRLRKAVLGALALWDEGAAAAGGPEAG